VQVNKIFKILSLLEKDSIRLSISYRKISFFNHLNGNFSLAKVGGKCGERVKIIDFNHYGPADTKVPDEGRRNSL